MNIERPTPDNNLFLEFYKTTLDYRTKVISIIFASGVAVAIPNIVTFLDNRNKAENERQRQTNEIQLKHEEQKLKEIELQLTKATKYQDYIAKFIDQAMSQDIELRIRFAEYFAAVSEEPMRWEKFRDNLIAKRDDLDNKSRQLAQEQTKAAPDTTKIAALTQQLVRLEQQTKAVAKIDTTVGAARALSPARLLQVLGSPASEITDQTCQKPNEAFAAQLGTESVGKFKVTMLRPAIESLKAVLEEAKQAEPALIERLGTAGGLCIRYARGTQRLSSHAFGVAIDLTLDGKFLPIGSAVTGDLAQSMGRIAEFFERAGWLWGGKFAVTDPMHFEISGDLFDYWLREGKLTAVNPVVGGNR